MGDKKQTVLTIVTIIATIIAIVTGLPAFWGSIMNGFWWFVQHWVWTVLILCVAALVCIVTYWFWQSINTGFWKIATLRNLITLLLLVIVVNISVLACRYSSLLGSKRITGNIYYRPCEGDLARDPVADVTVFLSERRDFKSAPTGPDGIFTISDIPGSFQVDHLTAQLGGQDYPPMAYNSTGDYAIISRPCPTLPVIGLIEGWKGVRTDECPTEDIENVRYRKQFLLSASFPADTGKQQAFLTVALVNAPDVMILNAFVLSPSEQSGLYRNAMEGLDRNTAHRWRFDLPRNGLRIQVEVCLGSNNNSVALSQNNLEASYELR